ncbi:BAH AND TFIIS DOMAIN-CONTAINING PROTEIN-RELATED [Salix koriyanagi]|uniref:BAH AND TFIIS DOMAIN-CONTAINING PROTEIN-RELATED n=1 Tax=Salix koriyanagi TaxID=2511006 RepID=A0A9Q0WGJ6_9ROSI|nr:BAH AND TFIIS DOMAIN-CONTAINING PROTEIN-RELATED [Salix koriyanagi]
MHATVQPGGRSPKPVNGPTSTSQSKPGSDSVQNSVSSFPSQVKGKKRERVDQGSEPVKRERFPKMDDGDSGHSRPESTWKSEISKFTDRGELVDSEGVEKLVHLMMPERNEKKIDLVGRSILAGVVAATDKFDCLNRFVQLKGLPVFDEWLQEVHKGKNGDGSSPKDGDKSAEEFLLVLLRALDKLPVNLHALQTCNIGKSVNNLRTHKNLEIQKKARSLVDTWKKRVEAEMDANAKSGSNQGVSWTARSRLPEVSHGGNRQFGVSSEVAMKSTVVQPCASKTGSVKVVQGETVAKSASTSPGPIRSTVSPGSAGNNSKEAQPRNTGACGASDPSLVVARDEKSSSSSQSHNNSQSFSSDHAKNRGVSGKEDARSSTAGSMMVNKIGGGSLRHRKSVNGFPGQAMSGVQKETGSSRNSLHRNLGSEKVSQSSLTCEKALDVPVAEGNGHKLIVKIPNRGRSPAHSASGGSLEDPSVMNSRASSPMLSEKHDHFDCNLKEKNDAYRATIPSDVNNESWQSNDFKEVLTGSDEGDGSPITVPDEEHCQTGDDSRKLAEASKATSSSSANEQKLVKLHDASFSSMNALIESCAKYSEANASISVGDDIGMNLLASVAAGEMPKSDTVSPTDSPRTNTPVVESSCVGGDVRPKFSPGEDPAQDRGQSLDVANDEHEKRAIVLGTSLAKNFDGTTILISQEKLKGQLNGHFNSSNMDVQRTSECPESNLKSEEVLVSVSVAVPSASTVEKTSYDGGKEPQEDNGVGRLNADGVSAAKEKLHSYISTEDKINITRMEVGTELYNGSSSYRSIELNGEKNKNMNENDEEKPPNTIPTELAKRSDGEVLQPYGPSKDTVAENMDEVKAERAGETTEKSNTEHESNSGSAVTNNKGVDMDYKQEDKQVNEKHGDGSALHELSPAIGQKPEQEPRSRGSKLTGTGGDETEECTPAAASSSLSATGGLDQEKKVEFDLNEGFNADDGKYEELNNLRAPACSTPIQLNNPLPLPVSSVSNGLPASITVASAAKGPFVPPEDLLKNRGELGWKGSAATSAFRPAEPRKAMEISLGTAGIFLTDATTSKPSRPLLDIDLNVADERILEDLASRSSQGAVSVADLVNNHDRVQDSPLASASVRSFGGLDLDLNRVDEPNDMGNHLTSMGRKMEAQLHPVKPSSGVLNGDVSAHRDFDLNNGPIFEEMSAEPSPFSQLTRSSVPSQPSVSGMRINRINSTEMGNFPSWFPQGNTYPAVTIQSILSDRGEQPFSIVAPGGPQRMLAPPTGSSSFSSDIYRGPVLSSSPAMPLPSTPFQYPVFPFGTGFSLSPATFAGGSTAYMDSSSGGRLCFPAIPSQVLAPTTAIPSHYPRPSFVVNFPDGNSNGGAESSRKWGRQGLDLNAGPLGPDAEGRDETSSLVSRQLSVASSQALTEEQTRMYQLATGSLLKRKEPEGGWDGYKSHGSNGE